MIYYMIRHRESGEFMPELKRRGYSQWNPSKAKTDEVFGDRLTGSPRLFASIRKAKHSIAGWYNTPNGRERHFEDGPDVSIKDDGREKTDLQIVIVNIYETGVVES